MIISDQSEVVLLRCATDRDKGKKKPEIDRT